MSLEDQRARIAAYCAGKGWSLAETLSDDGVSGVQSEHRIAVKSGREANGFYRITPSSPLPAGEYGFIVLSGTSAGGRMFDFGVD